MLDIKFIRENAELVKMAAKKKKITVDVDRLLAVDDQRREIMTSLENRKAEQNRFSLDIVQAGQDQIRRNHLILEMQDLKAEIQQAEESLKPVMVEWQAIMLQIPNIPDMSVPDGESDKDNLEI